MQYQLSDRHTLSLSHTTSVYRPGITYLNPAEVGSPIFFEYGNRHVVGSRLHDVSLMYMFTGSHLTLHLSPSYVFTNDGISTIEAGTYELRSRTYGNTLRSRRFQFGLYAQWKPFGGTMIVVNNSLQYERHEDFLRGCHTDGWSDTYAANAYQQLPWKLQLSVGAQGQIGHRPSDIYTMQHSWYAYYANLQRSFLKDDRLTLRLGTSNAFHKYISEETTTIAPGHFRENSRSYRHGRLFDISVTYRFGALKSSVKKAHHSIENADEVGGITMDNEEDEE